MLGEPERDVGAVGLGQRAVARSVRLDHPQGTVGDVSDPLAGGIRAWVDHPGRRRQVADLVPVGLHRPQPAGQREGRQPRRVVGRVADDARAERAVPLPADALGLRQVFFGIAEQAGGVGKQPLRAGACLHYPQAAHRVIARPAAEEQHRRPVLGNGEVIRDAQREPLGTG